MEDLGSRIKHMTNELKHYVETRLELTVLNIGDSITYWIGKAVQNLLGYALLAIGVVFAMTALAIYLGEVLNERWAGYVIVASPFVIAGLIFVLIKPNSISRRIQHQILAELMASFEKEEDSIKKLPSQSSIKSKESEETHV